MSKPKIAIVGNSNVGDAIQRGAERAGYEARSILGTDAAEVRSTGAWGDIIVLAIPSSAREQAVQNLGNVAGKTIVDSTNLLPTETGYAGGIQKSGAEEVQAWARGAHVVKAFNTVVAQNMTRATAKGEALSLFVAGDDAGAKAQVLELGKAMGFKAVDVGGLQNARYLETLGARNVQLANGGTNHESAIAFKAVGA